MRRPRLGTVLLTLWGILLTAAVYTYIAWLQPSRLGSTVSSLLESSMSVQCDMSKVSLSLFPLPSLTVEDLSLRRGSVDHLEFHARRVQAQMSWFSLLRMKPIIRSLDLISPTLDISGHLVQQALTSSGEKDTQASTIIIPELPSYITGVRVHVENGMCRFASADGKDSLMLSGLNIGARLPGLTPGNIELSIDDARYTLASGIDLSARETKLALVSFSKDLGGVWDGDLHFSSALQMGALDEVMGHRISDPYRYFPMPEPLRVSLHNSFKIQPERAEYAGHGAAGLSAVLPMNGHDVPILLDVPFELFGVDRDVAIKAADVRMGDDRLIIDGKLSGLFEGRPMLSGRAEIVHFSLTRWFGFGRLMDPGLQKALDNITGAFEYFELTPKGVVVPRLTAMVEDILLQGSGSCKEFLKPDIRIDAHAKKADLNRVFTELHGDIPDMSYLPPPVLPFVPTDSEHKVAPTAVHVGYDIHISADDARIMNFQVGGADVHVIPAPQFGTMLTIDVADLYGGKAVSSVYLQDDIRVVADLKQVALEGPSAALAGYPVLTGGLKQAHADIRFEGGSGARMLTTLGGSLQAEMTDGSIRVKGSSPIPYRAFDVDAEAKASSGKKDSALPPTVDFTGSWKVALDSNGWGVKVNTPRATLAFSTVYGLPCRFTDQPLDILLTLTRGTLPDTSADLLFQINGKTSFDADKATLALRRGTVKQDGLTLTGDAAFNHIFKAPSVSGRSRFTTPNFRNTLASFGIMLPTGIPMDLFKEAHGEGAFFISSNELKLENFKGAMDRSSLSGHLHYHWKDRPVLNGAVQISSLDLDSYLDSGAEASRDSEQKAALPLEFLRGTDVQADISIDNLRVLSTDLSQVILPVTQTNGTLTIPASAQFPGGGYLSSQLRATALSGIPEAKISLTTRISAVNMLPLSKSREQKQLISGLCNAQAALSSTQHYWDDWRSTLNGTFSLLITNGALISPAVKDEGDIPDTPESRTSFQILSLSGAVKDGIASCDDFRLMDTLLNVTGEGTVDLKSKTIDATATITVAGIPELPLTIKGDLASPTTNYKLLGAVAGTVGNIGSTVLDIVGTVLSTPFKMLMGKRSFLPNP